MPKLDVTRMYRSGEIWQGAESVSLKGQPIELTWTDCLFGGCRPWFLCPACEKRVALLYDSPRWRCRTCAGLTYRSRLSHRPDRLMLRADKIRYRYLAHLWPRAVPMRQETRARLEAAAEAFDNAALILGMPRRLRGLVDGDWEAEEAIAWARENGRAGHRHQTVHARERVAQRKKRP